MADNMLENICPACGKTMAKVFMKEQNVYLDVCLDGCGGIFFDNREFEKFDEQHEDITPLMEAYKGKTFNKVEETEEQRTCPVCNHKMVKNFSSVSKKIEFDECYGCGGRFLDYTEIEKIREESSNEEDRVKDVMTQFYQEAGNDLKAHYLQYGSMKTRPSILSRILGLNKK